MPAPSTTHPRLLAPPLAPSLPRSLHPCLARLLAPPTHPSVPRSLAGTVGERGWQEMRGGALPPQHRPSSHLLPPPLPTTTLPRSRARALAPSLPATGGEGGRERQRGRQGGWEGGREGKGGRESFGTARAHSLPPSLLPSLSLPRSLAPSPPPLSSSQSGCVAAALCSRSA